MALHVRIRPGNPHLAHNFCDFFSCRTSLWCCLMQTAILSGKTIECFHVTSQSRENYTGGHSGVQLNGDLLCCMVCVQNAVQTWQLMDLPHKYVRYRYPVHVICETWAHWLHSSRLSHTSSYLLVHQDSHHAQKYHKVMQTYIIFHHVIKTLYSISMAKNRQNRLYLFL